jgi:2-methylaconitate cis-trans-isomerase PrpF
MTQISTTLGTPAYLGYAEGAPCPTLVFDATTLPEDEPALLARLAALRCGLPERGLGHVLKNAFIGPSRHPLFDLDYRFVQAFPDSDRFDPSGSCGHSLLVAVDAAARSGMIQALEPGRRIRVNVLNNHDNVVCEVTGVHDKGADFTAHFLCSPPQPLTGHLVTGEPVTKVDVGGTTFDTTLVSMGNPYIFAQAADLGIRSPAELFDAGPELFDALLRLRLAVCAGLGWDPGGAFPKIAALAPLPSGAVAVRAISVPSWHPKLALTGATCLATALRIPGTVPHRLATATGPVGGGAEIETPGGRVRVHAHTGFGDAADTLQWVSVAGKNVIHEAVLSLSTAHSTDRGAPCLSSLI